VTIDRQCGSSQQAVHFAAQGVMSGTQDLVVAGGLQNMSAIPISAAMLVGQQYGFTTPFAESPGWQARYGDQEVSQFNSAEMIAEKWDITREDMEEFALASHQRALAAISEGRFAGEIAPVTLPDGTVFDTDQCPRDTSLEKMAGLQPLAPGGRITAAVASQICDASTAMLIASEGAVSEHGLTPRARVHHLSVRGDDPVWMLTGPIEATKHALARSGLSIDDIDLFECNEAFASVVLAWMKETGAPHEKVNVNGGGISLGHPIGATGTRLMTTMLNELERTGGRYGLQTMCEGGGQANVTIIERL
jgi:acetyl-CoA C-acetyltransferase